MAVFMPSFRGALLGTLIAFTGEGIHTPAAACNRRIQEYFLMDVTIYGLLGHAGGVRMPLDDLEVDELESGREFIYHGRIYEIRSVAEHGEGMVLNVVMTLDTVER